MPEESKNVEIKNEEFYDQFEQLERLDTMINKTYECPMCYHLLQKVGRCEICNHCGWSSCSI